MISIRKLLKSLWLARGASFVSMAWWLVLIELKCRIMSSRQQQSPNTNLNWTFNLKLHHHHVHQKTLRKVNYRETQSSNGGYTQNSQNDSLRAQGDASRRHGWLYRQRFCESREVPRRALKAPDRTTRTRRSYIVTWSKTPKVDGMTDRPSV